MSTVAYTDISRNVRPNIVRYPDDHEVTKMAREYTGFNNPIELVDGRDLKPDVIGIIGSNNPEGWVIVSAGKFYRDETKTSFFIMVIIKPTKKATELQRETLNGAVINITSRRVVLWGDGEVIETTNAWIKNYGQENKVIDYGKRLDILGKGHDTGRRYTIHENTEIFGSCDGVRIRLFFEEGLFFMVTGKSIFILNSRWGVTPFPIMWFQAGGYTAERLFDTSKPFSRKCYNVWVVHPELLTGTRQMVQVPYIVLLPSYIINQDINPELVGDKEVDFDLKCIDGVITQPGFYGPTMMNRDEANKFLKYGHYPNQNLWPRNVKDPRLLPGEAVIVKVKDPNGVVKKIIKVKSQPYTFGANLRADSPNWLPRFYRLISESREKQDPVYPLIKNVELPEALKTIYLVNRTEEEREFVERMIRTVEEFKSCMDNPEFQDEGSKQAFRDGLFLANMMLSTSPTLVPLFMQIDYDYTNGVMTLVSMVSGANLKFPRNEIRANIETDVARDVYEVICQILDSSAEEVAKAKEMMKSPDLAEDPNAREEYEDFIDETNNNVIEQVRAYLYNNSAPVGVYRIIGDIYRAMRKLELSKKQ